MTADKTVTIDLDGASLDVPFGTPVGDVLAQHRPAASQPALAAFVDNRWVDLSFPVTAPTAIKAVDYSHRLGVLAYRRTASLILLEAVRQLFGDARVTIGQAEGNGYFYHVRTDAPFTVAELDRLRERMHAIIDEDIAVTTERVTVGGARYELSQQPAAEEKVRLLETTYRGTRITVVRLGSIVDIHHYPAAPRTGLIQTFALEHEAPGLVLRFPPRGRPKPVAPFVSYPKLQATYQESRRWLELVGIETAADLNQAILSGGAGELIRVAEGLHEKKIAQIADEICADPDGVRVVLIAGPSSSGKTTFSKRLSLQLRVNGVKPVALSTDNFYVDRDDTPRDADGELDFEAIEAIDLPLFNDVLARLLRGEETATPRFDFTVGLRRPREKWHPMKLERGEVLLIEGIHGLNPRLTESVPDQQKFRIYINALTQLCIDDHNRIFTSDTRLLRRIVRDHLFRGYSADQTIEIWPRVRRGELRNIFPFQGEADVMFNSALVYEAAVLRLYAERFLHEVRPDSPAYAHACRLRQFVGYFMPIFRESIPEISLLKEFIGGSFFNY